MSSCASSETNVSSIVSRCILPNRVHRNLVHCKTTRAECDAMPFAGLKRLLCLLMHVCVRHSALSAPSALDGLVIRNEPGTWFSLKVSLFIYLERLLSSVRAMCTYMYADYATCTANLYCTALVHAQCDKWLRSARDNRSTEF